MPPSPPIRASRQSKELEEVDTTTGSVNAPAPRGSARLPTGTFRGRCAFRPLAGARDERPTDSIGPAVAAADEDAGVQQARGEAERGARS